MRVSFTYKRIHLQPYLDTGTRVSTLCTKCGKHCESYQWYESRRDQHKKRGMDVTETSVFTTVIMVRGQRLSLLPVESRLKFLIVH